MPVPAGLLPRVRVRARVRVGARVGAVALSLALGTTAVAACSASSREPSVAANAAAPPANRTRCPGSTA